MTIYYKGARIGSYWHKHDARLSGFVAVEPGGSASTDRLANHIAESNMTTPFISLTASYCVALAYALYGERFPDKKNPAYVYEIEITSNNGSNIRLLDPVREIVNQCPIPPTQLPFHHDGDQEFLLGVVSQRLRRYRMRAKRYPPGSHALNEPANLNKELRALIFCLRDAEILAFGSIPKTCVILRHEIRDI